jgi:beta-glucosidase
VQALRAECPESELGIVLNLAPMHPASDSLEDKNAAWLEDGRLVRWFMDPLFKGVYPKDVLEFLGSDSPKVEAGDMAVIQQPIDYLGVNYYSRSVVSSQGKWDVKQSPYPLTDMEWEIYPQGLKELLLRLHDDYPLPAIYITENGAAFPDQPENGRVQDQNRVKYLQQHLQTLSEAIALGVPVKGYLVWSLLDNFEWASGYAKRFGIVHVDYSTQQRTLKDSALWYRSFLNDFHRSVGLMPSDSYSMSGVR